VSDSQTPFNFLRRRFVDAHGRSLAERADYQALFIISSALHGFVSAFSISPSSHFMMSLTG
jgi:hypothetical protein